MHWIQSHILLELTRHATRRYSQLRPRDVEGNLFMYHLKGLMTDGYVEKDNGTYVLSVKGLQYVGTLSLATGKTRKQPKILTTVVCKNERDEFLFVRWHRQPNTGLVSFPHGMMHYGQPVAEMAALELSEKAGLAVDVSYMGEVYVRGMRDAEVDRHMLIHIFSASRPLPDPHAQLRPDVCDPFWAPLSAIDAKEFVPGFYEVAQLVTSQKAPIFEDITVAVQ